MFHKTDRSSLFLQAEHGTSKKATFITVSQNLTFLASFRMDLHPEIRSCVLPTGNSRISALQMAKPSPSIASGKTVCSPKGLTKRCSQPPTVPISSFYMTSTLNSAGKLVAAGGG